jgi:hypothetical protein
MFDGVGSPLSQTFGLGISQPITAADLDTIERFFLERGSEVFHEVSPLANPSALALLNERGYQPFEFTSVMFRPINRGIRLQASRNEKIQVRVAGLADEAACIETGVKGWSEFGDIAGHVEGMVRIGLHRISGPTFLAEMEERPIGSGVACLCDGVALLAGACTIPEARRQGAQLALLEGRLRYAAQHGCDLAMMGALPGSASQRNAERHGFRIAYTRIKWRLPIRKQKSD